MYLYYHSFKNQNSTNITVMWKTWCSCPSLLMCQISALRMCIYLCVRVKQHLALVRPLVCEGKDPILEMNNGTLYVVRMTCWNLDTLVHEHFAMSFSFSHIFHLFICFNSLLVCTYSYVIFIMATLNLKYLDLMKRGADLYKLTSEWTILALFQL